jgi:uncharacterized protein YtpQ (UPF0354 family)
MRNWIKILLGVLTISCNSQTKVFNESEFTLIYKDALKSKFPKVEFKIDANLSIIATYQGTDFKHYLDNPFKEYKLQPDSLKEIIKRYMDSSSELYNKKGKININRIIPVIKPIDYLDDLRQISKENGSFKEPWIVYEKYNDQLIIVYGEDTEKSISYFTQDDFANLNISKDTLLDFSINNLRRILPDIQKIGGNGSFGISSGGDFEASLILFPNLWTNENFAVDGDFIIAIPNKDLLFITGSNNQKEIDRIEKIMLNSYNTGNHPISPYLFKWNGKKFEKYK